MSEQEPTTGTSGVDFHTPLEEMEVTDHPHIKGLPRRRQDIGATLLEPHEHYPWLRANDHVPRLTRLISLNFGLVRLLAGWVPNCPSYMLKTELPQRIYEDMRHLLRLRDRLNQLPGTRGPIEATPEISDFLDRLGAADDHHCFLSAFYFDVKRAMLIALEDYMQVCDPLYDAPTIYELRGIIPELREQLAWANQVLLESRLDMPTAQRVNTWRTYTCASLAAIGGIFGDSPLPATPLGPSPARAPLQPAPEHFLGDPQMRYMDRFPLSTEEDPVHLTLREIVYHNATEWAVIDHLYILFFGAREMPLEFYHDLARHTWDEARHSRMGMRRLTEMGFEPFKDFQWPYTPTRITKFAEWFGGLTMLAEACSFTRKHGSVEPFYRFGDPLSAQQSEVDCVDERLHVTFGRKWLPTLAQRAGDDRPLQEIVRSLRERSLLGRTDMEIAEWTEAKKRELAHNAAAFCNAIEFSLDFTVY